MNLFFYNLLLWLASPLVALWLSYRALAGRMPGLRQRLGFLPANLVAGDDPVAWLHAVSLGEVKSAHALADELRSRVPDLRIVFTASTRTGYEEARRRTTPRDIVLYPPIDYRWICRRFLRAIRPQMVAILETELWPNLFRQTRRSGTLLYLVSARISDRSLPRYQATRFFWRSVLALPTSVYAQSTRDAERFLELGAPADRVHTGGNLKFRISPHESAFSTELISKIDSSGAGPVIVAGSTMPGEEKLVLEAFQTLLTRIPRLWMILAPRHPERFDEVAELIQSMRLRMERRSSWTDAYLPVPGGVLLLDSIGELASVYQIAKIVLIGGTLVPTGGHNLMEAAFFGKPIIIGPSMENFREICDEFLQNNENKSFTEVPGMKLGAVLQIPGPQSLAPSIAFLLNNPQFSNELGAAAAELLRRNQAGVEPMIEELSRQLLNNQSLANESPTPARKATGEASDSANDTEEEWHPISK